MERTLSKLTVAIVGLAGGLAGLASAAGVFLRGDLATNAFTTVRGDLVDVLTGGTYAFNGKAVAAEGVGWDLVTLFLVVPALLWTLPALWRGSLRATLIATGILVYFLYQYFEYATFLAYGPLFVVYVAIAGLSVSGIALLVSRVDVATLPYRFSSRFPRRSMVGFGVFMALLLSALWLPLIARTLDATSVPELNGATTLVVQAFDLALLVPLGLFTAAAVHRRLPVGYLLAAIVVVKGTAMATGIVAMLVVEYLATDVLQPVPIAIFAFTALLAGLLGARVYSSIEPATQGRIARPMEGAAAHPMSAQ